MVVSKEGGVGDVVAGVVEAERGALLGIVLKDQRDLYSVTVRELDQAGWTWQDLGQRGWAR